MRNRSGLNIRVWRKLVWLAAAFSWGAAAQAKSADIQSFFLANGLEVVWRANELPVASIGLVVRAPQAHPCRPYLEAFLQPKPNRRIFDVEMLTADDWVEVRLHGLAEDFPNMLQALFEGTRRPPPDAQELKYVFSQYAQQKDRQWPGLTMLLRDEFEPMLGRAAPALQAVRAVTPSAFSVYLAQILQPANCVLFLQCPETEVEAVDLLWRQACQAAQLPDVAVKTFADTAQFLTAEFIQTPVAMWGWRLPKTDALQAATATLLEQLLTQTQSGFFHKLHAPRHIYHLTPRFHPSAKHSIFQLTALPSYPDPLNGLSTLVRSLKRLRNQEAFTAEELDAASRRALRLHHEALADPHSRYLTELWLALGNPTDFERNLSEISRAQIAAFVEMNLLGQPPAFVLFAPAQFRRMDVLDQFVSAKQYRLMETPLQRLELKSPMLSASFRPIDLEFKPPSPPKEIRFEQDDINRFAVYMHAGQPRLSDADRKALQKVATYLEWHPEKRLQIFGHTVNSTEDRRYVPTREWAEIVAHHLSEAADIPTHRLISTGAGNIEERGTTMDRKVTFRILD